MHPGALLDLATELLRAVLRFEHPADAVVSAFFRNHRTLGARERHALAETAYAVLRERLLLQHLAGLGRPGEIGKGSGKGSVKPAGKASKGHKSAAAALERRLAMLAWQGSPTFLRGALGPHEAQWLEEVQRIDRAALPEKLRHNLPDWLAGALRESLGDQFWPLAEALNRPAPLDLRVNLLKARREEAQAALAEAGITAVPTPYSPWGLRVEGKPALNKAAAFNDGLVEVQDEGSQLLALLTDAKRGEMVADFCAGAGGKTLALGAAMRNTGRLYAFDVSGHRLDALKPRLARSGLSNVHPVQIAHERDERIKRLGGKIDRVLVDAPCSGLGTLRRNPDLKWRQSPASVAELREKQQRILSAAASLLKPGGRLVYATCSLLAAENEEVVRAFDAERERDFEPLPVLDLLQAAKVAQAEELVSGAWLRLWPHQHQTDGFFAAVWRRR
ncbi:MAG: RsmB/NOP family class I SAM-dependent RNA methyltransferase [Burkholderiales bacterium]|nr:RsmB/NOP family class I SAM-dependent RNA methyltransferase [Burkholderiales bacterium]